MGVNGTTETLSQFFLRHCLKQSKRCSLRARSRESPRLRYHSPSLGLQSAAIAAVRLRRNMPPIALAHAILTIVAPRKMESAHSRIRKKKFSAHNCKHCFNQCRFLFRKLKKWTSRLQLGKKNQFLKKEVLPKI